VTIIKIIISLKKLLDIMSQTLDTVTVICVPNLES